MTDSEKLELAAQCEHRAIRKLEAILGWPDESGGNPAEPANLLACAAALRTTLTKEQQDG